MTLTEIGLIWVPSVIWDRSILYKRATGKQKIGNRSKRPHYQNAPTFYQNALTFKKK